MTEYELTCGSGSGRHIIGEKVSMQLDIVPMQIRVIKHVRKVYDCRDCKAAPVTAGKPGQLVKKSCQPERSGEVAGHQTCGRLITSAI